MASDGNGFVETTLQAIGTLLGAAEADAASDGLIALAIFAALVLIVGSWFLRPGALDALDFSFDHVDHSSSLGGDGAGCGDGDGSD